MKFQIGKLYLIEFLDHVIKDSKPATCRIACWILEDHKEYVYGTQWFTVTNDKETFNENVEKITVLKSAIKKRKILAEF